jgi:hypothetical protein
MTHVNGHQRFGGTYWLNLHGIVTRKQQSKFTQPLKPHISGRRDIDRPYECFPEGGTYGRSFKPVSHSDSSPKPLNKFI